MIGFLLAGFVGGNLKPTPQLTDASDPLESDIASGSGFKPSVSIRFLANGDIEEATGSDAAPLSYSKVGTWVDDATYLTGSEWELNFTVDSEDTGAAGTWTGSTRGSYTAIGSTLTYTWAKDTTANGSANSEVTISVREIADTANVASRANMSFNAIISP